MEEEVLELRLQRPQLLVAMVRCRLRLLGAGLLKQVMCSDAVAVPSSIYSLLFVFS